MNESALPRMAMSLLAAFATALSCVDVAAHELEPPFDRVDLSAAAFELAASDTLVATLYVQAEATRQSEVATEVNRTMSWALERVRSVPGVKSETLHYRVTPVYRQQVLSGWRGRQSLRLESRDAAAVGELMTELQQRLAVESVRYDLAPETRTEIENRVIRRALAAFEARAALVSEALGRAGYRIVAMDVQTGGERPEPIVLGARAMAAETAALAGPVLEAGEQRVQVTVRGTIQLQTPP